MCEPEEADDAAASDADGDGAGAGAGGAPLTAREIDGKPLFFQHDQTWGADEYARSTELPGGSDWCGTDIAQCGCAMTSVANVLSLFDIISTPQGEPLDPRSFNDWLNRGAQRTASGWISAGYFLGDVVWTDVQAFTAMKRRTDPSVPLIRYRGWGNGSEDEARAELLAGRAVVLELQFHFVAAVGIEDGLVMILDPFFPERTRYADIAPFVLSSRLFEVVDPGVSVGGITVMAQADVQVTVTDQDGNVTGAFGSAARDLASGAPAQISDSIVRFQQPWRDPTCTERLPAPDAAGNVSIFIPRAAPGTYTIDIVRPPGDERCIAIYRYDDEGNVEIEMLCGTGEASIEIEHKPGPETPTPTPTATETATPEPTETATATPRPAPAIASVDCAPAAASVAQLVVCSASILGTVTAYEWSSNGSPTGGSQPQYSVLFNSSGTKRVTLRVCNGSSCSAAVTTVSVLPPLDAAIGCAPSIVGLGELVTCMAEDLTAASYAWSAAGDPATSSGPQFATRFQSPGVQTIRLLICSSAECVTATTSVTVIAPLTATVSCFPTLGVVGQPVTCSANVSGGPVVSYSWSSADQFEPSPSGPVPSTSNAPTFVTTYAFGGTKLVNLNICNALTCANVQTAFSVFSTLPPPKIESFNCLPDAVFPNGLVTCSASLSGVAPGGTFSWSTLGGSPKGGSGPLSASFQQTIQFSTRYSLLGAYRVTLSVCNGTACVTALETGLVTSPLG